ncbi:MAG TPA: hypothetical protein PKA33_15935 [Amaricoccus sp.]|uniref:hypothetical protein n=1 Tax=Amaricoccus sp. TaxID=1872485 RepID=UPI002CBCE355|nr:hypothetical protein [Amaricoccus sp.]HMQ92506.1 hypothetical protein [Amaricoccus sp.]HMR53845.1 hypothetical protein [Amaricoccus sp.]HMR58962.1 hypothetical protein [Amaricoccus sp.]HMU00840.1 hypothetical protein [Amaricoccus sp.]
MRPDHGSPVRVSYHVLQRISQRAGASMDPAEVLALIPAADMARMEAGEHVTARIKRLALDVVCRDRCLTTAMHSHRWRTAGPRVDDHAWRRARSPKRPAPRVCQAHLDADEEIVVGGRVRRVPA